MAYTTLNPAQLITDDAVILQGGPFSSFKHKLATWQREEYTKWGGVWSSSIAAIITYYFRMFMKRQPTNDLV